MAGRRITPIFKAKRFTGAPRLAVVTRLGKRLRHAWPHPLRIVRGDSPLAYPEVMPWSEEHPARSDVTGVTRNRLVTALAREVVEQAKRAYGRDGGKLTRFHATRYQAGTWSRSRRVVIKGEVSEQGVTPRLVVTDREQARTQGLSQHSYGARGPAANEMKDHQLSLQADRPSCHRFEAKQFRLFLPSAASVFLDPLRREV